MDRLNAMRVFVAVADAGGLSPAGRRLGMPLTTVSRQLKALEEALDTRLVTRTTRRLALTEPGRAYLETCRRVLSDLDAAERRCRRSSSWRRTWRLRPRRQRAGPERREASRPVR